MSRLDWAVLAGTLLSIVAFGLWRGRRPQTAASYLRGGSEAPWWTIGLSIMATQASAITFLSMPGQAHEDGLGFVQFYFGLPVAMVLLSATIVPIYYRLKVYTAYEYLETRFDRKTRQLTALLFLVQRGLGAGLSIYAPAIILSTVLGWPLQWTNLVLGAVVVLYTVSGGTKVVSQTQTWQMTVILLGMAGAFAYTLHGLPADVDFGGAMRIAGAMGKLDGVDFSARLDTRYTFWSGLTGGLFVQLAYFGTDQSQVQRYLSGASLTESRLGLLFNGLVKIPMQLGILMVGVLVFVFHQFQPPPVFANPVELAHARAATAALSPIESAYADTFVRKQADIRRLLDADRAGDAAARAAARAELQRDEAEARALRARAKDEIARARPGVDTKDADYIFISFVLRHFPPGLVGLLLAVILCAAMSATASALNALGTTSVIDFYKPSFRPGASDRESVWAARGFTVFWGLGAVGFAAFASMLDNLIQAVNILGSLFYGPTLGVFLVGFALRRVGGTAVFIALIAGQAAVIAVYCTSGIGFLWYNVIGCTIVVVVALLLAMFRPLVARSRA